MNTDVMDEVVVVPHTPDSARALLDEIDNGLAELDKRTSSLRRRRRRLFRRIAAEGIALGCGSCQVAKIDQLFRRDGTVLCPDCRKVEDGWSQQRRIAP